MVRGALGGLRQPSFIFSVRIDHQLDRELQKAKKNAQEFLQSFAAVDEGASEDVSRNDQRFIDLYLDCISTVLAANHHPIFHKARILSEARQAGSSSVFEIQQPCLDFHAALAAIILCTDHFAAAFDQNGGKQRSNGVAAEITRRHRRNLERGQLKGFNTYQFLKTAHDLDVPWFRLSGDTFQFGYGRCARLLNSSFSDRTSWIGNSISKNKYATSKVLKMAGLPVVEQIAVSSREQALEAARRIGFPVVVKPVDLDRGQGVTAFLTQPDDVAHAYENAAQLSDRVVVERHFLGKDYRVQIVDGQVQGILERAPAGIRGDGVSTVEALIEQQNLERKYAKDDRRFLHPIQIDSECRRMLRIQGFALGSVPPAETFLRLKGAANVASGGVPSLVDVAEAHPDNIELALRATRVVRLDVAGVDLITRDIGTSWLETGAAICEVNAQPQMFTTFHQPMLEAILGETRGQIPIFLVLEPQDACNLGHKLFEALSARYPNVGFVSSKGVYVGSKPVAVAPPDVFDAARALLIDPLVESVVLSLPVGYPELNGWPVDRCDVAIVDAQNKAGRDDVTPSAAKLLREIGLSLRPRAAYFSDEAASWACASDVYGSCKIEAVSFEEIQSNSSALAKFANTIVSMVLHGYENNAINRHDA